MAAEQASRQTGTAADTRAALVPDEAHLDRREADDGLAHRELQCLYQAPPPRRRKRQLSDGDVYEKIAQYERILLEHGLLPQGAHTSPSTECSPQEPISLRFIEPNAEMSKLGKVVVGHGRSRYINSTTWRSLEDDEMQHMSMERNHEEEESLMGFRRNLLHCHPTHAEAMILWNTHIENVEPICKVLHIPSSTKMVDEVSRKPETASREIECVLFAVYHFAVFTLTEEKCEKLFGRSRDALMQKYHLATRQALVNASFLTTTDISVVQALVLFLLACRHQYDPNAYWILTGVAVRIAQRMGLHRDGEALGLSPKPTTGTGIAIAPESWDTKEPLNINDDQIWPGMTTAPREQKGATEMIFCLARACIGKFFARSIRGTATDHSQHHSTVEPLIREAESEVEEKYIRYCDITNPLHFLTIGMARSAITAMRIKIRLPRIRDQTATDAERKELFQLAHKIIDTDAAAYAHTGLQRYQWHVRSFWA
ncbi:hypothetical protein INS49_003691 [Diaporthe citri]|uniref:uncharacterized protein n=1 Tax=Diaporthe citri TaxID=83186 RepID=UPI001C7F2EDF|nr:uncharacterized protein INS49_003691 [Diaporthe citri]KAG6355727.1 hypothetical protein INS49_003691 [Diaporthe citri]